MTYLPDTNIFIQAKNEYYGFDVCPGFWEWLEQQNEANKVFSIEPVQAELVIGQDELAGWARARGGKFFGVAELKDEPWWNWNIVELEVVK